jgi:hypothetical protein
MMARIENISQFADPRHPRFDITRARLRTAAQFRVSNAQVLYCCAQRVGQPPPPRRVYAA